MVLFALFSLTGASLSAEKKNKNPSKSSPFEVEDFNKCKFLFNHGIKRSQCWRIGEYFNNGWAKIRLFKTGSDYSHHLMPQTAIKNRVKRKIPLDSVFLSGRVLVVCKYGVSH